jgi:ABC-type amino acid transport substrate-binding protein
VGVYQGRESPLGGFAWDVMQILARDNEWQLTFQRERDVLAKLENDEVDIVANVPHVQPYTKRFRFGQLPLFYDWSEIYTAVGSAVDSPVALQGKKIGVPRGSQQKRAAEELVRTFRLGVELVDYPSAREAAAALARRETDAAVLDRAFALSEAESFDIEKMPYSTAPYELRFAVADDSFAEVLSVIDGYLEEGRGDGSSSFWAAYDKWFPRDRGYHPPKHLWWLVAVVALSLAAFILGRRSG